MKKLLVVALVLGLSACASTDAKKDSAESKDSTPAQFASVVSRNLETWNAQISEKEACSETYISAPSGAAAETCYALEKSSQASAGAAVLSLSALKAPKELKDLAHETKYNLEVVANTKLDETCGTGAAPNLEAEGCQFALAMTSSAWDELKSTIAAWKPYL